MHGNNIYQRPIKKSAIKATVCRRLWDGETATAIAGAVALLAVVLVRATCTASGASAAAAAGTTTAAGTTAAAAAAAARCLACPLSFF